ncbi:host-nuclease inhibitor Gam family protein [Cohnella sp. AR92]|uniref:host-nuclease inhibitor Gam family protein n=1 Tax=Cohnella sp. AR92 TaxID=648716 RepID=UPI001315A240|nr:host-nuclease inhibitor Gam family protein [Cohnella sp. AR92]
MNAYQLNEFEGIPAPEEREQFRIETIDQVNWALRKLAAIEAKQKEAERLAEAELHRIRTWLECEKSALELDKQFFESQLGLYALNQRDADPKWTKASTPYGTVKFRKQQPKWHYDDATLVESLKSAGRIDLIRIKEEPNKVDLKKSVKVVGGQVVDPESGAVLDGVKVEEQADSVVVEVGS